MSADLHLYALPNTPDSWEAIALWEAVEFSVHGDDELTEWEKANGGVTFTEWERRAEAVFGPGWSAPNVWVGQVSWIKAGFLENGHEKYIPDAVLRIHKLTEGGMVLTRGLMGDIMAALNYPNRSIYRGRGYRGIEKRQVVKKFLAAHIGEIIYPESL